MRGTLFASSIGLLLLASSFGLLTSSCSEQTRCRGHVDCPAAMICSNEKNPRGEGICISPCDQHVAAALCVDAGAAAGDAGSKDLAAAKDLTTAPVDGGGDM